VERASALDVFCDFIEAPDRAAEAVRERPPVWIALAGYAAASLSVFLAHGVAGSNGILGFSLAALGMLLLSRLALGVLLTGLVHMAAETFGGNGRALPLFVLMGLSDLAWTLLLPATLLMQVAAVHSRWMAAAVFLGIYWLCLSLRARSIRHNYRVGALKAWAALLSPYAAAAGLGLALFAAALWGLAQQAVRLFS